MSIDYTKMTTADGRPFDGKTRQETPAAPTRWWTENLSPEDVANSITTTLDQLHKSQTQRQAQSLTSARLYGNLTMMASATGFSPLTTNTTGPKAHITYNVAQSCVDTVAAKIAKNRPKPLFLTSDGDHQQQRRAKKLNQFVDGVFYENGYYQLAVDVFRDAAVFGTGVIHVFDHNDRVAFERVLATEIYVDEVEAFYGKPRQLHRVKSVDREVLKDEFPDSAVEIARTNITTTSIGQPHVADMLTVRESWHLPSGPNAKDGRHVITTDKTVLFEEEWDKDFFPFAFFHWCKRLYGFWGQGLVEQIQNIQLEINKLLWTIQRSMHLAGTFKIFMENTSKIDSNHVNNDIGTIIKYTGTPPQYVTPSSVPPEIYQHLQTLKNDAFSQAGISQLSASSVKPAGLNSGRALREMNDIESDRFMVVGQAFEQLALDVARLSIATIKDIAGRGSFKITVPGRKTLKKIDWKEVSLDEDDYVMQAFPVSSLPTDPAGRLETITEMAQAGYLSPVQARRLLDFPDLAQVEGLTNAEEDYLNAILEKMVDEGEYTAPEPYDNLALARELANEYYAKGKLNNLDQERLELLRTFMAQIEQLMAPQPVNPAPVPGQQPQAVPQAPPVSDLIPNTPS